MSFNGIERLVRSFRDKYLRNYKHVVLPQEIYRKGNFAKISFCITCKNRLFHLKETIQKNIKDNRNYPNLEFILIDFNSEDGLENWVKKNLKKEIEDELLTYYKTPEPEIFHASKAKNLAHLLATGEILCNLDGDNYTGKDFAFYINHLFQSNENAFYHFTKKPYWGTEGRLVFRKEDFNRLGGYDEKLLPIGHEDHDLMNRAKAIGINYNRIEIENFLHYLSNTTQEKAENCTSEQTNYYDLESENRKKSNQNISAGRLIANIEGTSSFTLYKNFEKNAIEFHFTPSPSS